MEWKGCRQRKEVGPRERQDLTTKVERQDERKELWKRTSIRKAQPNLPKGRERAKAKARKVSQVENPAKIEKVHVETVPVIQTREIHTLFRVPCGCSPECPVRTDVTNGIALKRQFILGFPRRDRCAI